ncbi:MAG: hypothetical protein PHC64_03780 [Candidatus Gastranaerophilales bacterium]|nr:hypothetical protein [Candidatus Gastranaerophilales bacterium]
MQVQQISNLPLSNRKQTNTNQKSSQVSFKGVEGALTYGLNYLQTNPAMGAVIVDLISMIIPRTAVDFTRGTDAGVETGRRELSCGINTALVSAYGVGAAALFAGAFNKEFGVKAHGMLMDDETLDILSHTWNSNREKPNAVKAYLEDVLNNTRALNPDATGNEDGWVKISPDARKVFIEKMMKNGGKEKDELAYLKALLTEDTGVQDDFKIGRKIAGELRETTSSLDDFVGRVYNSAKAFAKDGVVQAFQSGDLASNSFLKRFKKINIIATAAGLLLASGIGLAQQPINMYMTMKKTGKKGFVGVEGKEADNSTGFKVLKTAIAVLATVAMMSTITKNPAEILKKVQFKGLTPTIDQFKFIYGLTIASRLVSSRDKNELRETTIKDSLGFANWLILGGFVSKLAAAGFEKYSQFGKAGEKFVRYNANNKLTGWRKALHWIQNSSVVSREEVLTSALKKTGIKTIKENGMAMGLKEMLKEAPAAAKKKVAILGLVQLIGYAYSCLVLGIGIPKLNIWITNKVEKNKKKTAENQETKPENKPTEVKPNDPLSAQVLAFKQKNLN